MWWDLIPDADCFGVEGEHGSVDAVPGGYVIAMVFYGFNRPGGGVMLINLIRLFNIL